MRFYVPAELFRHGQQTAMQNPKPVRAVKVMRLLISGSSEKISSATGKLVGGRVGPRCLGFGHETTMLRAWLDVKSNFRHARGKAAEGCRSPRRCRAVDARRPPDGRNEHNLHRLALPTPPDWLRCMTISISTFQPRPPFRLLLRRDF